MKLERVVDEVANEADSVLVDCINAKQARQALADHLEANYPELSHRDHQEVVNQVIQILDEEGFFGTHHGHGHSHRAGGHRHDDIDDDE